jgi:hypothetical protein
MAKQTTLEEFNSVYPKLEETLLDHARSYKLPQEQLDWYKKVILNLKLFPTSQPQVNQSPFHSKLTCRPLVPRGQPSRWKMQPRHVRSRFGLPPPREASH